jgi:RNA polymerase sigma-70 factor (ECF subfamily)
MEDVRNERSDAEVIREILGGNINAFELLMDRYEGYVAGIATKHVPRDRIQEVAHEAFVRAYRSLETFKAKTPFKHWLATIAVRCCQDFWRQHYRRRETPISSISEDGWEWIQGLLVDGSADASGGFSRNPEALRVLRWAMKGLSAEDRTVLTLVHLEEYTTAEAAELLRWSVPKVKIRAHRARKKLRKTLAAALPDR